MVNIVRIVLAVDLLSPSERSPPALILELESVRHPGAALWDGGRGGIGSGRRAGLIELGEEREKRRGDLEHGRERSPPRRTRADTRKRGDEQIGVGVRVVGVTMPERVAGLVLDVGLDETPGSFGQIAWPGTGGESVRGQDRAGRCLLEALGAPLVHRAEVGDGAARLFVPLLAQEDLGPDAEQAKTMVLRDDLALQRIEILKRSGEVFAQIVEKQPSLGQEEM